MKDRDPERLGIAAAALAAAAACVLLAGSRRPAGDAARSEGFQRLAGGLGGGAALSLEPCEGAFDPAGAPGCALRLDPVPGGSRSCPHHAGPTIRR